MISTRPALTFISPFQPSTALIIATRLAHELIGFYFYFLVASSSSSQVDLGQAARGEPLGLAGGTGGQSSTVLFLCSHLHTVCDLDLLFLVVFNVVRCLALWSEC